MTLLDQATPLCNGDDVNQPLCERCNKPFTARSGSGGKPQRFCSSECRTASHTDSQRSQRQGDQQNVGKTPALVTLSAVMQPAKQDAPAATSEEDRSNWCWSVPHQARIECAATVEGEVEIEQINPLSESDNQRIWVSRGNAVQLARNILFATGFKGILIATTDGGGCCYRDVEDGDLPEHFED